MTYLKKYYNLIKCFKSQIILGFILAFANLIATLILPNLIGSLTNQIENSTLTKEIITRYSLYILGLGIFNYITTCFGNFFFFRNHYYADKEIRLSIFYKALSQSPLFFKSHPISDIINKSTSDSTAIGEVVGYGLMTLVYGIFFPIIAFIFMFRISPILTIIPMVSLPIMVYLISLISIGYDKRYLEVKNSMDKLNDTALETYNGIKVIKTFNLSSIMGKLFMEKVDDNLDKEMNLQKLGTLYVPVVEILLGISSVLSFVLGASLIKKNQINYGQLVTFSMYLIFLTYPAYAMSDLIIIWKEGKNSFKRIEELIEYDYSKTLNKELLSINSISKIEFKEFSFDYPGNENFSLRNINFVLEKGKRYGIVGKTGSGKTSILRNIIREYPNYKGNIIINDIDIEKLDFDTLRKRIGYVPQEHFLFSKTIKDNIKFYRNATDEDVEKAITASDFTKDIRQLPEGVNTLSGELGISLSGGQKQRISLSRALLTDVDILVLDDVLSAVDNNTEKNILNNLNEKFFDKIVVMTSHKISAIKDFDEILVIDNGQISERGDFYTLIKNRGWFYEQSLIQGVYNE
ncbi:MAG: ABC transporter ATP-binding protein [Lagierella massiliensis]|nr:ABC transporter ATP-binding protein [Lagierella massiliensis]